MNTFNPPRRGNTYRDDFNSWQPAWRIALDIAMAPFMPFVNRAKRYLRDRQNQAPPLSDHIRRDIGLPPVGDAPRVSPPVSWPLFR